MSTKLRKSDRRERFPASYDPETDSYVMDRDLAEAYPDPGLVAKDVAVDHKIPHRKASPAAKRPAKRQTAARRTR